MAWKIRLRRRGMTAHSLIDTEQTGGTKEVMEWRSEP
jgi:hypothetical protein